MQLLGERASRDFLRFFELVRDDIFAFSRAFDFKPTNQQAELLKDVQELTKHGQPTHVAAKSGQGTGKTTCSVIIGLFRSFRSYGALTAVTAPTMRQCKDVWLAEARARVNAAPAEVRQFFEVRATEIEILGTEDWGVKLVSASKPENIQGTHNKHLTFLIEEASGVDRKILEAIMGTMTNADKLVLAIGNPNRRGNFFYDCFGRDRANWATHTLNSELSPIVDQASVRRAEAIYGRHSDFYRVRILGEFPDVDPNCVMSSDDLEACAQRGRMLQYAKMEAPGSLPQRCIAIDFARKGSDATVIYRRSGLAIVEQAVLYKQEPDVAIARAFEMQRRAGWRDTDVWYVVDVGGLGGGCVHHFYNAGKQIHEFNFGGSASGKPFHDTVSEAFFELAAFVKARGCYLPADPELIQQLSDRQYNMTLKSKIKVESKDEYQERTDEGSPDKGDATVMVFYPYLTSRAKLAKVGRVG